MPENLEQIGIDAVDRFISTFNSRDKQRWADSLNFPHVRPSPFGNITVARTEDEYISRINYERIIETGWHHSEWDYKKVVHACHNKIHVAGQWSRYTQDGNKILSTPIVYIVTNNEGHWGIQSRFGSDDAADADTTELETRAFQLIETFIASHTNKEADVCKDLLNYPHFQIGVGHLNMVASADDFEVTDDQITVNAKIALQTGKYSINVGLDLFVNSKGDSKNLQAVLNITLRDDHLGIQAWSILEPATPGSQGL